MKSSSYSLVSEVPTMLNFVCLVVRTLTNLYLSAAREQCQRSLCVPVAHTSCEQAREAVLQPLPDVFQISLPGHHASTCYPI